MSRARSLGVTVLMVLAAIVLALGAFEAYLHLTEDPLADVRAYYDAGARLNAGLPLYVQAVNTDAPGFYRYPPLLAIVFRPLALLSYEAAALIWEGAVVVATILTFRHLGLRRAVFIVGGLLAISIAWTIAIGQAQALVTLLLAIGAPWAVAIAANLKLFPVLVALYWVGRQEWRRLGVFLGWMAGLVVFQFVLEPSATIDYLRFLSLDQVGQVNNLSPYAVSPLLWVLVLFVLVVATVALARTRWGWPAAIALSVFASPRLLTYQLSTLLAALGGPDRGTGSGRRHGEMQGRVDRDQPDGDEQPRGLEPAAAAGGLEPGEPEGDAEVPADRP